VHDGFSYHPDPQQAFAAAVLMALPTRPMYGAGNRDDLVRPS